MDQRVGVNAFHPFPIMDLSHRQPPGADRRVQLLATCLCDAFYDDVAIATVEVLEHLGCTVEFPEGQTCCGQPAFNAGDWAASRRVVRHTARVFAGDVPIIVPSGSCAAMLFHGAPLEFEDEPDRADVAALGRRAWELADFIVHGLGVKSWPGCGFGGTFAVGFPNVSSGMGALKLEHVRAAQPDLLVSADMSCLMHLGGLAEKEGKPIKTRHLAQVLRDALKGNQVVRE